MFVNCPYCQSLVAIDAVTGVAPEHCPYCDGAIAVAPTEPDASVQLDARDVAEASSASASDVSPDQAAEIDAPGTDDGAALEAEAAPAAQTPQPTPTGRKRRKNTAPSFARRSTTSEVATPKARWPWPLAAALLLLLLLQLVLADRASLAASPRWRAAIVNVCNALRCDLPPWREVGAFTMLTRDVQAHPGVANALRIRAAFRNDAHWPQPWPQLVVTLSDASGRVTGSRTFTASEYLGDAPTQKLIATGQTAAVALEIREPAPDTVSFSFDFR